MPIINNLIAQNSLDTLSGTNIIELLTNYGLSFATIDYGAACSYTTVGEFDRFRQRYNIVDETILVLMPYGSIAEDFENFRFDTSTNTGCVYRSIAPRTEDQCTVFIKESLYAGEPVIVIRETARLVLEAARQSSDAGTTTPWQRIVIWLVVRWVLITDRPQLIVLQRLLVDGEHARSAAIRWRGVGHFVERFGSPRRFRWRLFWRQVTGRC